MQTPTADSVSIGCQIVCYGDVQAAVSQAVRAEDAGFDSITVPDHLFHPPHSDEFLTDPPWEALTVLGAIAQATDRVRLFPGVTDTVRRHPTEIAHAIATIDRLSGGRAGLGIGAGEAFNFDVIDDLDWEQPFTRFVEAVELIDSLWRSTADQLVSFDGEYFQLQPAHLDLDPVQTPRPPLWVGGYGPSMRGFTGAVADGWFPWIHAPEPYAADLERVLSVAEERGRDPAAIERAVMVPTVVDTDGDRARSLAIERSRARLALRPQLLDALGHPEIARETTAMVTTTFDESDERKLLRTAERIPESAVERCCLAGTPEAVIEQIETFQDAGVQSLVVIPVGEFDTTVDLYESEIIPAVTDQ